MIAPSHRRPDTLAGRVAEVGELERGLERLRAGRSWIIEVVGEPGIGKSRLLLELARRGGGQGHLVVEGHAAEFERGVPFGVVVDALNDYAGTLPAYLLDALGEDTMTELAALLPSLAAPPGTPAAGLPSERYRTHYAIRALLERLAAQQPTVLLLDDLH